MRFSNVLAQTTWLLLCEGSLSYRRIKREFGLDDAALDDLRHELITLKRIARDQDGSFLLWAGHAAADPAVLPSPAEPLAAVRADIAGAPASDAERRPLTVMFCDLADSTALSTRLDPEDLQDVIRAYQETCAGAVRAYEGFVAKYMGDGILVYFGYPTSLDRNAERAVRSALDIVEAIAALNRTLGSDKGVELAVRIGIATGMVMVGEMVGEGLAQERTVVGEAPNMAARLQGLAQRNGIVIGSLTRELSGEGFVYQDMGGHELKGIAGAVRCWRVAGAAVDSGDDVDEDEGDGATTAPPLVGRDEETGLLRRAWESTRTERRGQVVTVSGEAGIGKSVLIDGLRAEVRAEGLARITMRCSPYHAGSALHPVIMHIRRLAGWQPADSPEVRLAKLEAVLAASDQPLAETVPLLASLLALPLPEGSYPPLAMTPQQQKRQTQDTIIAMILEAAERQPLLALWEDLHWADLSTLELLGLLIEQTPTASLLMVLTARPEFVPPWPARSHITPITLNRLERPHAAALVARIAGGKRLPAEVVDHIVDKTDGVPLYVEELTKTILGAGILRDTPNGMELTGPLASLAIPDTLQDSLMARLDRLPQVRELAQLGSVLGREFAYEMISGLSSVGETMLQEGLGQLVEAELLYQRGRPPRARYIFKHALLQDAAYASLLRRSRQQVHLQVANLMESQFPDAVEANPSLVAHHFTEANVVERAVAYLQKAGERSLLMSANEEAISHLDKALALVGGMPASARRDRRELKLLMRLGPALIAVKGYGATEVEPAYRRALALCEALGDSERQLSVLLGLSLFHFVRADLHISRDLAERLVELARTHQEPGCDLAAERALGYPLANLGQLERAKAHMDHVAGSYDIAVHGSFAARRGGSDFGVGALSYGGLIDAVLGYPDQAAARCARGLALARQLEHPISEAFAHWMAALVHLVRGEPQAALASAQASADLAQEKGYPQYRAWANLARAAALSDQGDHGEAIDALRAGLDECAAIGSFLINPLWMSHLARALAGDGRLAEGHASLDAAFELAARTDDRFSDAELHRVRGELLLAGDSPDEVGAESALLAAVDIARTQKARTWELRAATDLARLWQGQGRQDEARHMLAPIHGWFTEGFETADLVAARDMLDDLGGGALTPAASPCRGASGRSGVTAG